MYFTRVEVKNEKLTVMSEYISTRFVRKDEVTSYYVAKCLTHRVDPTIVNTFCFIKQTMIKVNPSNDLKTTTKNEVSNLEHYQKLVKHVIMQYNNQIKIHECVMSKVNFSPRHFSKLHDYWHDRQGLYHRFTIVTKYEEYGDLNHFLEYIKQKSIQLSDVEVVYVMNNILKSSLELYKIGICHRDIKPENIFIDEFFQFKLGDFGVSMIDESKQKTPISKDLLGTYGFMAPDYFLPEPYSFPVDVWAIGVIIYRMIYLQYPYDSRKDGYNIKIKKPLMDIRHQSPYSDKFEKRLKDFNKRFFQQNPKKRQKSINLYQYEYMHEFRPMEVTSTLRKKYEDYIKAFNKCNMVEIERYPLQQYSLYHDRVIDMVRYEQWGYFFLLSNLKVVGLFNSTSDKKVIRIYPDCLQDVENPTQDLHCNILNHIQQIHFKKLKDYIEKQGKIFSRHLNCTVSNIVQYKDTLVIRLKNETKLSKKELKARKEEKQLLVNPQYQNLIEPNSANKNPINFSNNTLQVFFFPQTPKPKYKNMQYITYQYSIILNNNMVKKDEVLISEIRNNKGQTYKLTRYPAPEDILYSNPDTGLKMDQKQKKQQQNTTNIHRNMYRHLQRLLSFTVSKKRQEAPQTVEFLNDFMINQI